MDTKEIIKHLTRFQEDLEDFKSIKDIIARNNRNDFLQQKIKILIDFLNK